MEYEIKVLDLMDVESSFLVLVHEMGIVTRTKTWSLRISGDSVPAAGVPVAEWEAPALG